MLLQDFLRLSARERSLIAFAVLLDGIEAEVYLANDSSNPEYKQYASWFGRMPAELRMPYVGSLLREALSEIKD